jgi:hypothetical protein
VVTILEQDWQKKKKWRVLAYKKEEAQAAIRHAAEIGGKDKLIRHVIEKLYSQSDD